MPIKTFKSNWSYFGSIALLLFACQGDEGIPGINSLINTLPESAGSNCFYGGTRIEYGLDKDNNNILSSDEIQNHSFICNGKAGEDGASYLFDVKIEGSGVNCPNGGYNLISGLDSNKNGILDLTERSNSFYLCSAQNYISNSVYENPGQNCRAGGYKLTSGLDSNINAELDPAEITLTQFICNGNGVADKITRLEIPAAAANTSSSDWVITGNLVKFNKSDFATDSILFVTDPYTGGDGNSAIVELYNITDNLPIVGGLVSTSAIYINRTFLFSSNIFTNLPNKEITIGVRTKSSVNGNFASNTGTGLYLFIYKK